MPCAYASHLIIGLVEDTTRSRELKGTAFVRSQICVYCALHSGIHFQGKIEEPQAQLPLDTAAMTV